MAHIYGIKNPIDNALLYIGICNDFERRKYQHLRNSQNEMLRNEIYSIQLQGAMPEFYIIEQSKNGRFSKSEFEYIKELKPICNVKKGNICISVTKDHKIKQMPVGVPEYMYEQLENSGKINQISFSGYVRTLIENDLKDVPSLTP
jgi:GIY-YIG catalytic domain-containing protein